MKTNEPIKIQRDETIIYGSQLREEYISSHGRDIAAKKHSRTTKL